MKNKNQFVPIERSTLHEQEVSSISVNKFIQALEKSAANMRSFTLLRHGKLIAEKYWNPYAKEYKVWVYSISKSFTSTAIGMAIDEGLLELDDCVLSFFPQESPANPTSNLSTMKVRHLLSMSTGHAVDTLDSITSSLEGEWVKTFLSLPVEYEPGTHFVYNSGASFMLSAIIETVTKQTLMDYLTDRLFKPLGFGEVIWDKNQKNVVTGGWGIMLRAEDLAKLGQLYLDKGSYQGKRIVSEKWVEEATRKQVENSSTGSTKDWSLGYGFQFWRCQNNAYRADGAFGQYAIVLPEQDAVLSIMSETSDMQEILDIVWEYLLPAFSNTFSQLEKKIHGKVYQVAANTVGITTAKFHFKKGEMELIFTKQQGSYNIKCGRGMWLEGETRIPFGTASFIPMVALEDMAKKIQGYFQWKDEKTLEIVWVYCEMPHRERMICNFEGDRILISCPPNKAAEMIGLPEISLSLH